MLPYLPQLYTPPMYWIPILLAMYYTVTLFTSTLYTMYWIPILLAMYCICVETFLDCVLLTKDRILFDLPSSSFQYNVFFIDILRPGDR